MNEQKEKKEIFKRNFLKVKALYKQKKYRETIELGGKLQQIANSVKLVGLINKARKNELKDFLKKGFQAHKQLSRQKNWPEGIEVLKEIISADNRNEKAKALLKKDKIRYIDEQLHSEVKKELIKNQEYEKLYKFYQKLYLLFPNYKKLKQEIREAEKLILKKRRQDESEFIKESIQKTKTLFEQGKYEESAQAAKEVLKYTDGESKAAVILLKKASRFNTKDTEKKLAKKLENLIASLEQEFKDDPKGFVRI
ncbi:MAG: hypothetical protein ABII07_02755 [Patescibacteria group bacterium]|nr:hypothetical protein [Patescibacteria group bacterium]